MAIQQMSRSAGGVFESARLGSRALVDAGFAHLAIFTTHDRYLAADMTADGDLETHAVRAFGPARFGFAPAMVPKLLAAKLDALIIHGLWTSHSLAGWIWHRVTRRPVIVVPHGMLEPWIMQRSPRLKRLFWRLFTRDLLERASAVQVLTEREAAHVTTLIPGARCVLIHNFVPQLPEAALTRHPGWWRASDSDKIIFLFFGRIHEKKGVLETCRAWRRFNVEAPDIASRCELVFCGWNDGVTDFEDATRAAGGEAGNARYAGPQYGDEKWRSMAASSFMLLPSKSEGLPMSILEGWSAGLPAIMTDECNLPVGFAHGAALRTGTDETQILASLKNAARLEPSQRTAMAAAGRALVAEEFSQQRFADRMIALCKTIMVGR